MPARGSRARGAPIQISANGRQVGVACDRGGAGRRADFGQQEGGRDQRAAEQVQPGGAGDREARFARVWRRPFLMLLARICWIAPGCGRSAPGAPPSPALRPRESVEGTRRHGRGARASCVRRACSAAGRRALQLDRLVASNVSPLGRRRHGRGRAEVRKFDLDARSLPLLAAGGEARAPSSCGAPGGGRRSRRSRDRCGAAGLRRSASRSLPGPSRARRGSCSTTVSRSTVPS